MTTSGRLCFVTPEAPGYQKGGEVIDLHALLSAGPVDLAEEVRRGDHDGALQALLECSPDPTVGDAIRARLAALGA